MVQAFEVSEFSASAQKSRKVFFLLAFQSLGAIYGDIGTSPLYALQTVMMDLKVTPSEADVLGAVSLVLWSLIWLVCLKYCFFVMRAHNNGEGGIFALYSILKSSKNVPRPLAACAGVLAIVGAAFIVSDGGLTPAVSILSAVEGFLAFSPSLTSSAIVGITVAIVVVLFMCQRFGTAKVSSSFAPITSVWFVTIAVFGIINMAKFGGKIWSAFNPGLGIEFLVRNGSTGFTSLGAVFLAVTGLEAMYADIGHFGVNPVRAGWLAVVFPAVTLSYLGQGAALLKNPSLYTNLFYSTVPGYNNDGVLTGSYIYTVILATLATIIASQATITGAFSLASHAVSLDFLPPIAIYHTSKKIRGQIYIPVICYLLMVLTVGITIGFGTSTNITNAYGLTVCTVMVFTTLLYMMVIAYVWAQPWWKSVLFACLFLPVDFIFLAANYEKVPDGGYVPLITGVAFAAVMLLWRYGQLVRKRSSGKVSHRVTKEQFAASLELQRSPEPALQPSMLPLLLGRTPNVGVFVCPESDFVPPVVLFMLERSRTCPQVVVFFHTRVLAVPTVPDLDRIVVANHGADVFSAVVQFGYAEACDESELRDFSSWMMRIPPGQLLSRKLFSEQLDRAEKSSADTSSQHADEVNPERRGPNVITFFFCEEDYVLSEHLNCLKKQILSCYLFLRAVTRPNFHSDQLLGITKVVSLGVS